jgi:uncharacterized membrane protein YgcG
MSQNWWEAKENYPQSSLQRYEQRQLAERNDSLGLNTPEARERIPTLRTDALAVEGAIRHIGAWFKKERDAQASFEKELYADGFQISDMFKEQKHEVARVFGYMSDWFFKSDVWARNARGFVIGQDTHGIDRSFTDPMALWYYRNFKRGNYAQAVQDDLDSMYRMLTKVEQKTVDLTKYAEFADEVQAEFDRIYGLRRAEGQSEYMAMLSASETARFYEQTLFSGGGAADVRNYERARDQLLWTEQNITREGAEAFYRGERSGPWSLEQEEVFNQAKGYRFTEEVDPTATFKKEALIESGLTPFEAGELIQNPWIEAAASIVYDLDNIIPISGLMMKPVGAVLGFVTRNTLGRVGALTARTVGAPFLARMGANSVATTAQNTASNAIRAAYQYVMRGAVAGQPVPDLMVRILRELESPSDELLQDAPILFERALRNLSDDPYGNALRHEATLREVIVNTLGGVFGDGARIGGVFLEEVQKLGHTLVSIGADQAAWDAAMAASEKRVVEEGIEVASRVASSWGKNNAINALSPLMQKLVKGIEGNPFSIAYRSLRGTLVSAWLSRPGWVIRNYIDNSLKLTAEGVGFHDSLADLIEGMADLTLNPEMAKSLAGELRLRGAKDILSTFSNQKLVRDLGQVFPAEIVGSLSKAIGDFHQESLLRKVLGGYTGWLSAGQSVVEATARIRLYLHTQRRVYNDLMADLTQMDLGAMKAAAAAPHIIRSVSPDFNVRNLREVVEDLADGNVDPVSLGRLVDELIEEAGGDTRFMSPGLEDVIGDHPEDKKVFDAIGKAEEAQEELRRWLDNPASEKVVREAPLEGGARSLTREQTENEIQRISREILDMQATLHPPVSPGAREAEAVVKAAYDAANAKAKGPVRRLQRAAGMFDRVLRDLPNETLSKVDEPALGALRNLVRNGSVLEYADWFTAHGAPSVAEIVKDPVAQSMNPNDILAIFNSVGNRILKEGSDGQHWGGSIGSLINDGAKDAMRTLRNSLADPENTLRTVNNVAHGFSRALTSGGEAFENITQEGFAGLQTFLKSLGDAPSPERIAALSRWFSRHGMPRFGGALTKPPLGTDPALVTEVYQALGQRMLGRSNVPGVSTLDGGEVKAIFDGAVREVTHNLEDRVRSMVPNDFVGLTFPETITKEWVIESARPFSSGPIKDPEEAVQVVENLMYILKKSLDEQKNAWATITTRIAEAHDTGGALLADPEVVAEFQNFFSAAAVARRGTLSDTVSEVLAEVSEAARKFPGAESTSSLWNDVNNHLRWYYEAEQNAAAASRRLLSGSGPVQGFVDDLHTLARNAGVSDAEWTSFRRSLEPFVGSYDAARRTMSEMEAGINSIVFDIQDRLGRAIGKAPEVPPGAMTAGPLQGTDWVHEANRLARSAEAQARQELQNQVSKLRKWQSEMGANLGLSTQGVREVGSEITRFGDTLMDETPIETTIKFGEAPKVGERITTTGAEPRNPVNPWVRDVAERELGNWTTSAGSGFVAGQSRKTIGGRELDEVIAILERYTDVGVQARKLADFIATKKVDDVLFDYSHTSNMETLINSIIPFGTWNLKNQTYWAQKFASNPAIPVTLKKVMLAHMRVNSHLPESQRLSVRVPQALVEPVCRMLGLTSVDVRVYPWDLFSGTGMVGANVLPEMMNTLSEEDAIMQGSGEGQKALETVYDVMKLGGYKAWPWFEALFGYAGVLGEDWYPQGVLNQWTPIASYAAFTMFGEDPLEADPEYHLRLGANALNNELFRGTDLQMLHLNPDLRYDWATGQRIEEIYSEFPVVPAEVWQPFVGITPEEARTITAEIDDVSLREMIKKFKPAFEPNCTPEVMAALLTSLSPVEQAAFLVEVEKAGVRSMVQRDAAVAFASGATGVRFSLTNPNSQALRDIRMSRRIQYETAATAEEAKQVNKDFYAANPVLSLIHTWAYEDKPYETTLAGEAAAHIETVIGQETDDYWEYAATFGKTYNGLWEMLFNTRPLDRSYTRAFKDRMYKASNDYRTEANAMARERVNALVAQYVEENPGDKDGIRMLTEGYDTTIQFNLVLPEDARKRIQDYQKNNPGDYFGLVELYQLEYDKEMKANPPVRNIHVPGYVDNGSLNLEWTRDGKRPDVIDAHITDTLLYQLGAQSPDYEDYEDYDEWIAAQDDYYANLVEHAMSTEEAKGQVQALVDKGIDRAEATKMIEDLYSYDDLVTYWKANDNIYEAIDYVARTRYYAEADIEWNDAVKLMEVDADLAGPMFDLIKEKYPVIPATKLMEWVLAEYPGRFTPAELAAAMGEVTLPSFAEYKVMRKSGEQRLDANIDLYYDQLSSEDKFKIRQAFGPEFTDKFLVYGEDKSEIPLSLKVYWMNELGELSGMPGFNAIAAIPGLDEDVMNKGMFKEALDNGAPYVGSLEQDDFYQALKINAMYRAALEEGDATLAALYESDELRLKYFAGGNASSHFWDIWFNQIPPGNIRKVLKDNPLIALMMDKPMREAVATQSDYDQAAKILLDVLADLEDDFVAWGANPEEYEAFERLQTMYFEIPEENKAARRAFVDANPLLEKYWNMGKDVNSVSWNRTGGGGYTGTYNWGNGKTSYVGGGSGYSSGGSSGGWYDPLGWQSFKEAVGSSFGSAIKVLSSYLNGNTGGSAEAYLRKLHSQVGGDMEFEDWIKMLHFWWGRQGTSSSYNKVATGPKENKRVKSPGPISPRQAS